MPFAFDRIRTLIANIFSISGEPSTASGNFFLWEGDAPGSENRGGKEKIRVERKISSGIKYSRAIHHLLFFPPPGIATGAAIIIAPGGGHRDIWINHEGYKPAEWFSKRGMLVLC